MGALYTEIPEQNTALKLEEFAYIELPHDMVMAFWSTFFFSSIPIEALMTVNERLRNFAIRPHDANAALEQNITFV